MYSENKKCVCCGSPNIETKLNLGKLPLAGDFKETREEALNCARYPHEYMLCSSCETVFSKYSVDSETLYNKYNYNSSQISSLKQHFDSFAKDVLIKRYHKYSDINFVEIGGNSGVLLNCLPKGWNKFCVDPSDVAKEGFENNNLTNWQLFNHCFNKKTAQIFNKGSIDVVSGSNCLAHFPQLQEAFESVYTILKPDGDFWIEVKCLDSAIKNNRYTDFYIEHLVVHSVSSLCNCLGKIGFQYIEHKILPFHGGLIRILFRKTSNKIAKFVINNNKEKILDLQLHYNSRFDNVLLIDLIKRYNKIIAYGASGECTMFANQFQELIKLDYVIDQAPIRIGKYIPGTGNKIVNKDLLDEGEDVLCIVTAPAYFNEIVKKNAGFRGKFISMFDVL